MSKTLFTPVHRTVRELIMEVETGKLGLPDLQRGYVWRAAKVRDLLDSMLKGYPIGYLMIWDAADDTEKSKTIGIDKQAFRDSQEPCDRRSTAPDLFICCYVRQKDCRRKVQREADHHIFQPADPYFCGGR